MLSPPCLSGVTIAQSIAADGSVAAVIDATCCKMIHQHDSICVTLRENVDIHFLTAAKYEQCQGFFFNQFAILA